ncbi:MAG: hypothetical protein R3B06_29880 [Kofleriaceae bacterium]
MSNTSHAKPNPWTAFDQRPQSVPAYLVPPFVGCAPICVLHVASTPPTSPLVLEAFARHPRAVAGFVNSTTIEPVAEVTAWINDRQRALGWAPSTSFPDGYYLFVDREARAYHAGNRIGDDYPATAMGSCMQMMGAVDGLPWLTALGRAVMEGGAVDRVIASFAAVLPSDDAAILTGTDPALDELGRALAALGVSVDATREEVTRRHRELTGEAHPMRVGVGARSRAAAKTRRLDQALAVIRDRRGWH